jgi:hypothetical protein
MLPVEILSALDEQTCACVDMCCGPQVALDRLTAIVSVALRELASKRYEEGLKCLSVDPGWMSTDMGGPDAPIKVEEGARVVVERIIACLDEPACAPE